MITNEICQKCAECCKNFPYIKLQQDDISAIERESKLSIHFFADKIDEEGEEYFLQFKENGDCFFLIEENGHYSCGIYQARSKVCRDYPSSPKQHEVCFSKRKMMRLNNSGKPTTDSVL